MKTKLLLSALGFYSLSMLGQVPTGAVPNIDYETFLVGPDGAPTESFPQVIDVSGNFGYIAGYSFNNTTQRDYLLVKYNANTGAVIWQQTYDFVSLIDRARAVTVDNSGNVYVTGESQDIFTGYDLVTLKYDPNGNLLWSKRFNGTASMDDKGTSIAIDPSGNVFVCGFSTNTGTGKDFTVIKYSSAGVQQYVYTKNGTAVNSSDVANKLVWDANKLYVTGNVQNLTTNQDIYVTSLNANNANVNWSQNQNGTANGNDQSIDIKLNGNEILVCGGIVNTGTNQDYFFARLNVSGGFVFIKNYDAFGGNDFATSLVADASSKYAVVGLAQNGTTYDYHTTYYLNNGTFQWVNKHITNSSVTSVFPKITTDVIANHFYVSGVKRNATLDGGLYQITPGGNEGWSDYHDCASGLDNAYVDMAIDNMARIYIAGVNEIVPGSLSLSMIRYSQTPVYFPIDFNNANVPFSNTHLYYENTGEILNTTSLPAKEVLYYTNRTIPRIFVQSNSMSFIFAKQDSAKTNPKDSLTRADLVFVGSNPLAKPYKFDTKNNNTLNWFLPHTGFNGKTDVKGSSRLMIPNIYRNIDLHYYSNSGGLKYYFVVKPGGKVSDIQLHFDGTTSNSLNGNNDLIINTIYGSLSFKKPVAYNVTFGLTTPAATASWVNTGVNNYSLNVGSYTSALPLVIEIDRGLATSTASACDWSTYHGSTGAEVGESVITDAAGNVFFSGQTDSPLFPNIFGGALAYNGLRDAFLVKFNSLGVPQWGTFYGGEGNDDVGEIAINSIGNIYMVGTTLSNSLTIQPVANTTLTGLQDGFVAKFNSLGNTLLFARYFGGTNDDAITSVAIDASDNVYFVGATGGGGSFPITVKSGAYTQTATTASNGFPDAFIAELDVTDNLIWASYFGGNDFDNFSCVRIGANNHVFCAGSTSSKTNALSFGGNPVCGVPITPNYYPDCNPGGGAYYTTYNNGGFGIETDAIIVEFDITGALLWSTYFGGNSDEISSPYKISIAVNPSNPNIIYLSGTTNKIAGFPIQAVGSEYVQTTQLFGSRAFIAKFNNRQKVWATIFGPGVNTIGRGVVCDNNNNVYVVGSTQSNVYASNSCTPATNQNNDFPKCQQTGVFFQPAYGGGVSDAFICAFNSLNQLIWSSYYGGTNLDEAHSISYDNTNKRIYMTGVTQSQSGFPLLDPSTGNWQFNTNSGSNPNNNRDAYIARFCVSSLIAIGIKEYSNSYVNGDLLVYPNPTENNFTVEFNSPSEKGVINIELYNSIGKLITERKENLNYSTKFSFNTSSYAKGVYFIRVSTEKNSYNSKLIIN